MKKAKLLIFALCLALLSAALLSLSAAADGGSVFPASGNVVFVSDGGTGDGSSAQSPLAADPAPEGYDPTAQYPRYYMTTSLYQAAKKLADTGGTIVICGRVTLNNSNTFGSSYSTRDFEFPASSRTLRLTSVYDGVDYRKTNNAFLYITEGAEIIFGSDALIENMDIVTAGTDRVICFNNYTGRVGEGVNCYPIDPARQGQAEYYVSLAAGHRYMGHSGWNLELTVESGTYNKIVGGAWGTVSTAWNGSVPESLQYAYRNVPTLLYLKGSTRVLGRVVGSTDKNSPFSGNVLIVIEDGIYECEIVGGSDVTFTDQTSHVTLSISGGDFTKVISVSPQVRGAKGYAPSEKRLDLSSFKQSDAASFYALYDSAYGFGAEDVVLPDWFYSGEISEDPVTVDDSGRVIFIADGATGNGNSAASPLKATVNPNAGIKKYLNTSFYQAIDALKNEGGTVVICGEVMIGIDETENNGSSTTRDLITPYFTKPIKFTSVYNGVDYRKTNGARLLIKTPAELCINGESVWENIDIVTDGTDRCISFNVYKTLFGNGINCYPKNYSDRGTAKNYISLSAGHRYNALSNRVLDLTVRSGTYNIIAGAGWGTLASLASSNVTTNLTLEGTTKVLGQVVGSIPKTSPFGGYVNITVNGGIYECDIDGGGPTSFTNTDASVIIKIRGGNFNSLKSLSPIAAGASGNKPAIKKLDLSEFPEDLRTSFEALYSHIAEFSAEEIVFPSWWGDQGVTFTPGVTPGSYGDANGDGVIDAVDVVRIKRYFAEYDYASGGSTVDVTAGADVNGDGKTSSADIVRLKRYFASYDGYLNRSYVRLGPDTSVPYTGEPADPPFDPTSGDYTFVQKFEAPKASPREAVVNYMLDMAKVEWTAARDFTITNPGGSFSVNLAYKAGVKYRGVTYSNRTDSLEKFMFSTANGYLNPAPNTTYDYIIGNNCSQAMVLSFQQVVNFPLQGTLKPNSPRRGLLMFPLDEDGKETLVNPTDRGYGDYWYTPELKQINSEEAFYKAYSRLGAGDIVYKSVRVNGHTRLVDRVDVAYNLDGSINASRSVVYTIEQTNMFDSTRKDGVQTTWWIDHAYSFRSLYENDFMPVTLCVYNNGKVPQDAYITFDGKNSDPTKVKTSLNGKIESNFPLNYVVCEVVDSNGETKIRSEYGDWVATYSFDLARERDLLVGSLSPGSYKLKVRAGIARGGGEVASIDVVVG